MNFNLLGQRTYDIEESGEPPVPARRDWLAPETPSRDELAGRQVVVVGYGLQGRPTALNLRDSGASVRVGSYMGSPSWQRAIDDGFAVIDSTEGIPVDAEAVFCLLPDERQVEVLRAHLLPTMHPGQLLIFAHGYPLVYGDAPTLKGAGGDVDPVLPPLGLGRLPMPRGVDVVVLAPHGPGQQLRERYLAGGGLAAQVALWRDPSGDAFRRALLWGAGLGYDRGGMRPCGVKEEVDLDLFVEQTLLCGGLVELALLVYEAAVARGYDPEQVRRSTFGEVGHTAALLAEYGPVGLYKRISHIALKGSLLNGPAVVPAATRVALEQVLTQIESGTFIRSLESEPVKKQIRKRMLEIKEQGLG